MTDVVVNVFNGTRLQVPQTFQVHANTYQDIITGLIQYGFESGSLYGLNGEFIDTDSHIALREVNYVIPENILISTINIGQNNKPTITIKFNRNGTLRDIYNYGIVEGIPSGGRFIYHGRELGRTTGLNTPIGEFNFGPNTTIFYVVRN